MRLHEGTRQLRQQFARQLQLRFRRRDGEARRHRVPQPALAMPCGVKFLRLARARFGIVLNVRNGVAVHHRLAGDERHVAGFGSREKCFGTGLVNGAEGHGRRGAVLEQTIEENSCCRLRIGLVAVSALFRKGEAHEPVEQVLAGRGKHPVLREVDVGIDEARHDDHVAIVMNLAARKASGNRDCGPHHSIVPRLPTAIAPRLSCSAVPSAVKVSVCPLMTWVMAPPDPRCGTGRCGRPARAPSRTRLRGHFSPSPRSSRQSYAWWRP